MGKKADRPEHIIISGASRGLGVALAESLLQQGYRVSGFSRNESETSRCLAQRFAGAFFFRPVDVASRTELKTFVQDAVDRLGAVYGVINNAATVQEGILATLPEIEIARMLSVNLEGSIRLTRHCLRSMLVKGTGRVLNISSIVGGRGYNGLTVYSATKAGMDGFTRGLAREVGRRNITVNSIAPGYMRTEMSEGLSEKQRQQIVRRTPLGRLADLDDVVPLAHFLLSPEAGFITGQTIYVDGGLSN